MKWNWYVIQAFSNCEAKVKAALEERIEMSGLSELNLATS